jgi:hypothetical protein
MKTRLNALQRSLPGAIAKSAKHRYIRAIRDLA